MDWTAGVELDRRGDEVVSVTLLISGPGCQISERFDASRAVDGHLFVDGHSREGARTRFGSHAFAFEGGSIRIDYLVGPGNVTLPELVFGKQHWRLPEGIESVICAAFDAAAGHYEDLRRAARQRVFVGRAATDPLGDPRLAWLMPWARSVDLDPEFVGRFERCSFCEHPLQPGVRRTRLVGDSIRGALATPWAGATRLRRGLNCSQVAEVCDDLDACLARGAFAPDTRG